MWSPSPARLNASVGDVLAALVDVVEPRDPWFSGDPRRTEPQNDPARGLSAATVIDALNRCGPDDMVVSADIGNHRLWVCEQLDVTRPEGLLQSCEFDAMGFSLPAGIGAAVALEGVPVVAIAGDGGFVHTMNEIRKIHIATEEIRLEAGRPVEPALTTVIVAAVMRNPWVGRPFVEDLHPEILGFAHDLGALLADRLVDAFGSPKAVEAYGKSSVVGVDGEIEHANAMVHTLMFGDPIRARVDASSTLVFTNTRGGPGAPIIVPMVHKDEMLRRSHYHTAQTAIADAPRADEVVVAIAGASASRPFPRIGDRDLDRADSQAVPAARD